MPSKAGGSSHTAGMNSASTARASAHPYANAAHAHIQTNVRSSKRKSSVEEKPQLSPGSAVSPTDSNTTQPPTVTNGTSAPPTKSRKKNNPTGANNNNNPKSNRQQFSACHACRYRRVKCDLKDLSESSLDPNADISCTNCLDRGIRCKDDYAESKKQLRRGKRINQLELEDNLMEQTDDRDGPSYGTPVRPRTTIPALKPEFFDSPFYRRFYIQRPIIDPVEFRSRYVAWLQHQLTPESNAALSSATAPLSMEGQLLAKILVVWAAAYGVDEAGAEQPENSVQDVQKRRIKVKNMLEEVIKLVDNLSLLRKPTWDGVRCLLLTLPLTEDVLDNPVDRLAMYEAAIQQVYTLCQHDGVTTGLSPETRAANAMVRARIFWYAHVHEGLTTGLRGGRLLLDDDDLKTFQQELPPAPSFNPRALQTTNMTYTLAFQYATAPIRLASACRKVHAALTGPKARAAKRLDGGKLEDTWESLAMCWEEFESLRQIQRSDHVTNEDNTRFVDGWQIFLFECYNVIQEKIRDRLDAARAAQLSEYESSPDSPATVEGLVRDLNKYLAIAESKCFDLLDHVVHLIRWHLGSSFFAYDASLVRDGCFFAGHTLALMPGRDEDVKVCLQALSEMRWAFSKGNERSQSIRLAWRSQSEQMGGPRESLEQGGSAGGGGGGGGGSGGGRDPADGHGTPRQHRSNQGLPPQLQKRSRATPPTPAFSGGAQQQQLRVSTLPSHSAPSGAPHLRDQPQPPQPAQAQQHRHLAQDGNMSLRPTVLQLDAIGTTSSSFVDRGIDQNLRPNWSPVHHLPPGPAPNSIHSSSSDGSSPPEMAAQPMPLYTIPSKSPVSYDHLSTAGYQHPTTATTTATIDANGFSHSPLRTNGHHVFPPTGPPRNMGPGGGGVVQSGMMNPSQYSISYHAGPGHGQYHSSMASNGMDMNAYVYPPRQQQQQHPHNQTGYLSNPGTSPDELGRYANGAEYFPLPTDAHYHHNGVPSIPGGGIVGHDPNTYLSYSDSVYFAPQ